jgi:chloride channel protein, CIC family
MGHDPSPYVIVGMMCCFGSISRAPLAVMLMVAEMTGSLSILTPALVGVGLAWLIVHHFDDSIYRSQIRSRADTEARRITAGLPLLAAIPTAQAMAPSRLVLPTSTTVRHAIDLSRAAGVQGAPVVDAAGRFEGTVGMAELAETTRHGVHVGDLADAGAPVVTVDSHLDAALESIASADMSWVPVLDDDRRVMGTLSISDLVAAYRRELLATAQRMSALGASTGAFELSVTEESSLAGQALRASGLPNGTLVTSIARNGQVLTPTGDVVLEPGDRLSLLGYRGPGVASSVR